MSAVLLVIAGLPGVGKTTVAWEILARRPFVYVRIDTIEQALRDSGEVPEVGGAGYHAGVALARENLALDADVLVECVNPTSLTRELWHGASAATRSRIVDVELVCSDRARHERRVRDRVTDVAGLRLPTWADVENRVCEPWATPRTVVDTAEMSAAEAAARILASLR